MGGPILSRIRERVRDRFPRITRAAEAVASTVKAVVVGSAEARPVDRSVESMIGLPFLAVIRKAVMAGVGAATGKLYALVQWDISFLDAEITEWIVAIIVTTYLAWRFPNAPREAGR